MRDGERKRERPPPYHHDVILQPAAAYGELQVSHGAQPVVQCCAAIVDHVLQWEVVGCGPALKVLIPSSHEEEPLRYGSVQ